MFIEYARLFLFTFLLSRFKETIDTKLTDSYKSTEKKISEFVKMARWKDTNFWSVRNMVDKTRKVLHKTLRDYKKAMSVSCRPFFVDEGAEGGDVKQSIELNKVLLKPRTPAEALTMKTVKNLKGDEVGSFEEMKVTRNLKKKSDTSDFFLIPLFININRNLTQDSY